MLHIDNSSDIILNPLKESFNLNVSTHLHSNQMITEINCYFSYSWDFSKNSGYAYLISIDETIVNLKLESFCSKGEIDFISEKVSLPIVIKKQNIFLNNVILEIDLVGLTHQAILFVQPQVKYSN